MPRRKRGAPKGNQSARKHGFYSKVLDEAERLSLVNAIEVEGIDEEIAVLRVKIAALLEKDPDNLRLILEATNTLARLLRTKYNLDKTQGKGIKEAITGVLTGLAIPLGVRVAEEVLKK